MAVSRSQARRSGRLVSLAVVASLALVAGCTSSAPQPDTSPLSTAASAPPLYCGFVSQDSVDVAVGETKLLSFGAPAYAPNGSKQVLESALCSLNGHKGQVFGVQVLPLGARPDIEQKVVDKVASRKVSYVFPASYGVGYAQTYSLKYGDTKAAAYLLRGNYLVTLGLQQVAAGRDRLKDVVALTHQIVAFLGLPMSHTKPYPTPSPSS